MGIHTHARLRPGRWFALGCIAAAASTHALAAGDCAALAGQSIGGATIGSASVVPASATLAEYCKVSGLIQPALNFEVRLPTAWNRKLHYGGGGGYNGSIPAPNTAAINAGYAQVSSDSGHQGSGLDASFALDDPLAAQLFGSLSVPKVMGAALEIVRVTPRCSTA